MVRVSVSQLPSVPVPLVGAASSIVRKSSRNWQTRSERGEME